MICVSLTGLCSLPFAIFLAHHIYNSYITLYCSAEEDKYVVLLSGLCIGSNLSNPLQFQLLVDHITGHSGDEKVQIFLTFRFYHIFLSLISNLWFEQEQGLAAQIVHVVIAGNSVEFPRKLFNGQVLITFVVDYFSDTASVICPSYDL